MRRHVAVFGGAAGGTPANTVIEVFTFEEWDAIHEAVRPTGAALVPGVGYLTCHRVSDEQAEAILEACDEAVEEWLAMRG